MISTYALGIAGFVLLLALEPDYSARAETMPCEGHLPAHKMTSTGGGTHKFVDGRRMVGKAHSVGGCGTYDRFKTGGAYEGNYTFLSYHSAGSSDACLVKQQGGRRIYDSFQGTVIEADGYKWTPKFSVDDIDALPTTKSAQMSEKQPVRQSEKQPVRQSENKLERQSENKSGRQLENKSEQKSSPSSSRSPPTSAEYDTWRESAVVFGIADGLVVYPKVSFASGTVLAKKEYLITADALAEMGINGLGDVTANGAEFSENKLLYNCPFADASTESRCRMSIEFTTPISKLVILYAAAQKANQDPNAAIFFSELRLPCSCMCSTTRGKGVMYTEDPLKPGSCIRTEAHTETDRTACDMLASDKVCTFEYKNTMTRTGPVGPDGRFPCDMVMGPTMLDSQPYNPAPKP